MAEKQKKSGCCLSTFFKALLAFMIFGAVTAIFLGKSSLPLKQSGSVPSLTPSGTTFQGSDRAPAQSALANIPTVNYAIAKRWPLPNGGEGKVIVISPSAANVPTMTLLGKQLQRETQNDRNAFIYIYDNDQAAQMRDRVSSFTESDYQFYERYFIGTYMRNANNGVHEMEIQPDGVNGHATELKFNSPGAEQ